MKKILSLSLLIVLAYFTLAHESLSQRNLLLSQKKPATNDPFIGKWKWDNGSVRIVTANKIIYDADNPNWQGEWERIGNKLKFTYGLKEESTPCHQGDPKLYGYEYWVVIGTVNDDGTTFEGLNQLGEQKEYAKKLK